MEKLHREIQNLQISNWPIRFIPLQTTLKILILPNIGNISTFMVSMVGHNLSSTIG
jgi:hypothetical protein